MGSSISKNLKRKTKSDVKKKVQQDVHAKLLSSGAIRTQDHDFTKSCKKTSLTSFPKKMLKSFKDFDKPSE